MALPRRRAEWLTLPRASWRRRRSSANLGRSARDLGTHVSNASQKAPLRAMLQRPGDALAGELRRLRRDLDYPTETEVGSGVVVDGALRRRWLLATTAKGAG